MSLRPQGVALRNCFESTVRHAAEVSVDPRPLAVNVRKFVGIIDCGTAVYPDAIKAQMEGGVVMAPKVRADLPCKARANQAILTADVPSTVPMWRRSDCFVIQFLTVETVTTYCPASLYGWRFKGSQEGVDRDGL